MYRFTEMLNDDFKINFIMELDKYNTYLDGCIHINYRLKIYIYQHVLEIKMKLIVLKY